MFPQDPESPQEPSTAQFVTRRTPSSSVVIASGDIDAANATEFETHAGRHPSDTTAVVIDLTGVEFFGTAGLSALRTAGARCTADGIHWTIVPSKAVTRLMTLCDVVAPATGRPDAGLTA